jgi:hypothetical protein
MLSQKTSDMKGTENGAGSQEMNEQAYREKREEADNILQRNALARAKRLTD